ncbi:MAG TPA: hypothetical protein VJ746_05610 [Nitrospira sp.]|nr:hypothetical protein [Nitrospira sp.]
MNISNQVWRVLSAFCAILIFPILSFSASPIFWCPDRKSDQQYSAKAEPGCVPLAEKKDRANSGENSTAEQSTQDFKIENLQRDVSEFLKKYRHFLDCCKTDLTELRQVQELGEEVDALLASAQAHLSNYSVASRGMMLREIIPPVAKARADLATLRARLERLGDASNRRDSGDYGSAGREAAVMREIEESIDRDIRAPQLPTGPKTGASIGVAPAAGPGIGKTPKSGTAIGSEGKTGYEIGVSPRNSSDIGASGPTGFAIGGTGKAGPSIGESTFNNEDSSGVGSSLQRSTVGSTLSDSTVGSTLGPSAVGSNLQDSSVGSSFGGSSVGSGIQAQ